MIHGNGLVTSAGYDLDYRLSSLSVKNGASNVSSLAYAYSDGLNLTEITDQVTPANTNILWYRPTGKLQNAGGPWGQSDFYYDPVGNRTYSYNTVAAVTTTRQHNQSTTSNRLNNITENTAAFRSYTYDGAGNTLTETRPGETFAYTYNKRNRLSGVTRNTVSYATYGYNALEQLTTRTSTAAGAPVGQQAYTYDNDNHLITENTASTGAKVREYIWLPANDNQPIDLPLAVIDVSTNTISYVHADHLGRPTRMTNAAKATVWQATWTPWGEAHSISGTVTNNLRFPGQYFQIETGLHYNHHRNYDPVTGRYTQPDPLRFIDGPSIYAYAGSSPYMKTDRKDLDVAIVYGHPIGSNPFGHTGIGVEGNGVFSFGTGTNAGSSFTDYLNKQSDYRDSTVYERETTPAQDTCIADYLRKAPNIPGDLASAVCDHCNSGVADALNFVAASCCFRHDSAGRQQPSPCEGGLLTN